MEERIDNDLSALSSTDCIYSHSVMEAPEK